MATNVLLTIDTELTWRHFSPGAGWHENFRRSCEAAGAGVPWQLERLGGHRIKACFFIDPMPALVYGPEPLRRMVGPILDAGQEVQLHLHSFWFELARGGSDKPRFELTRFAPDEQRLLIATARDLLIEAGAPPPIAFRSGSYAADPHTLDALRQLGLSYDSSHNGAEHPWPSSLPFAPAQLDPVGFGGITEIPVTQVRCPNGGLRPFQLCALSIREMTAALRHAARFDHPLVTIVSHSFELATRDGRRVNKLVRGRFEQLCAFLEAHAEILPTARFDELRPSVPTIPSLPLPARQLRTARRMVEQAWGTARYERPALGIAMAAAAPLVALEELVAYAGL